MRKCSTEGCNNPIFSRKTGKCKYHIPKTKIVAKKVPKKVTKKQSRSNAKVHNAKKQVVNRIFSEYGYLFCQGCGTTQGRIDCSHIIPISRNKSLEDNDKNINLLCHKCHDIWEHKLDGIKNLNILAQNLKVMKELDIDYYNTFVAKLEL